MTELDRETIEAFRGLTLAHGAVMDAPEFPLL